MIKNIIFDIGGVIMKGTPISVIDGINEKDHLVLEKFFENLSDLDLGKKTLEEKYNQCNFSHEIQSKYEKLLLEYYKYREFNLDIINIIDKLKSNNYNVYILSNNNREAYDYCRNHKLLQNIEGWVVSCDYNCLKKDGTLFNILLNKYNLVGNECFFVDDSPVNIDVALKHGIKGHVFNENDDINELYLSMRKNNINI